MHYFSIFFLVVILAGCQRSYLSLSQEKVDARYLASTYVGTPDPRQDDPPMGQRVIINWFVPAKILEKQPRIDLHLLFWDYTQRMVTYPLEKQTGSKVYFLLGKDFEQTKGILTYKAEIVTEDGRVFSEWKHQLWVELITPDKDLELPAPTPQETPMDLLEELDEETEQDNETFIPQDKEGEIYPESVEDLPEGPVNKESSAQEMSDSVNSQSMQGSVTETRVFGEEERL